MREPTHSLLLRRAWHRVWHGAAPPIPAAVTPMANVAIDSVIGALKHLLVIEDKSEIMWKERCKHRVADNCGREREFS